MDRRTEQLREDFRTSENMNRHIFRPLQLVARQYRLDRLGILALYPSQLKRSARHSEVDIAVLSKDDVKCHI
jgi:hypothetical protein